MAKLKLMTATGDKVNKGLEMHEMRSMQLFHELLVNTLAPIFKVIAEMSTRWHWSIFCLYELKLQQLLQSDKEHERSEYRRYSNKCSSKYQTHIAHYDT